MQTVESQPKPSKIALTRLLYVPGHFLLTEMRKQLVRPFGLCYLANHTPFPNGCYVILFLAVRIVNVSTYRQLKKTECFRYT
jgi:hypothetical protein